MNLVGLCFNCLLPDHVMAERCNTSCYLRCHQEGHQAHACKRMCSLDSTGTTAPPLQRQHPPSSVVVINPRVADIMLASKGRSHSPLTGSTLSAPLGMSTPVDSPSHHSLPGPPLPPPLGLELVRSLCRQPHFELRFILRTPAMDEA
jgi:hypothetical protein